MRRSGIGSGGGHGSRPVTHTRAPKVERRNAIRIMVASRWPCRLAFAAAINRLTSGSVRYSRVRNSAFGTRLGGTVPLTVRGDTNRRLLLAM